MVGVELDSSAAAAASGAPATRSKRGPSSTAENAGALAEVLAPVFGLVTDLVEMGLAAPGLAMTEQEAEDIARPAARMLARTDRGKRFAKFLSTRGDAVQLAAALLAYGERVAPIAIDRMATGMQRQQALRAERQRRGQTIPATSAPGERQRGPRQQTPGPAGAPSGAAPAAGGNGHSNGNGHSAAADGRSDASSAAPLAHLIADPLAPNIVELYPGGIRPIG